MKLLGTDNSSVFPLIARVAAAVLVFPHGAQKLFGWFGGLGFEETIIYFVDNYGLLPLFTIILILLESLGALALAAGLFTRVMALGIGMIMFVAIFVTHDHTNFFLQMIGIEAGGIVFQILVTVLCLILVFTGGGKWSLDDKLYRRRQERLI